MQLSDQDIASFQACYKNTFGKEISKEDAYAQGVKLLTLMSAVYKPMTQEEHELVEKRRKETLPLLQSKLQSNESGGYYNE